MIKRLMFGAGAAAVLAAILVGRDLVSYARTSLGYVGEAVRENVPAEFQIDRARGLIKDLEPEIRRNLHVIAKMQVEVEGMEKTIAESEARLDKAEGEIRQLNDDLAKGDPTYEYGHRVYTADQVKTDLANRFKCFKTAKETLETKQEICDARQRSLEAARENLDGMLAAKRQLQVEVENLDARLKMVAAAQTTSDYHFDDSKLARAKQLIGDLQTRLDVAERLADAQGEIQGRIVLEEPVPGNLTDQVSAYFAEQPEVETLAND